MVGSHLLLPIPFQPLLQREYADILQQQYNKRYTFPPSSGAPSASPRPYSAPYWRDARLQSMKQRLNTTKAQLNELPLQKWHKHTRRLNPAGTVPGVLKKQVQPELLTQAWQKFHECFQVFNLGPPSRAGKAEEAGEGEGEAEVQRYNSVHLCEAPGAFVTSLNHALSSHHPAATWSWVATTLNPHYEGNDLGYMINDDRFIMGSLDNWEFGKDDTGDLMDKANLEVLVARAAAMEGGVHLVTADGSIDCQGNPGDQEATVADLHTSEALAALTVLAEGGSFVLKMFTFFESETVCLLYLLHTAFATMDVFKPATSKEGNSEVYVVCRGFKKSEQVTELVGGMMRYYGAMPQDRSLFAQADIPDKFLEHVRKCSDLFMQLQENVIENNLHYWKTPLDKAYVRDLAEVQLQVAERFMAQYKVEAIAEYRHVVYRRADPYVSQVDARTDRGTFLDKVEEANKAAEARLRDIRAGLQGWKVKGRHRFVEWVGAPALATADRTVVGRRVATVHSSKFCTGRHLEFYRESLRLLAIAEEGGVEAKRRKTDTATKPYEGSIKRLADYKDDVRILAKLTKIYPEILDKTKVLFLSPGGERADMLAEECLAANQVRLISTIISAVSELEAGEHLLVQGLPLYTRLCTAIFYCLASLFEETGFVRPQQEDDFIFLSNFLGGRVTAEESVARLESILTSLIGHRGGGQVLSVWPVTDLVQEPVYSEVLLFNQLRIKERVLAMTAFLEPRKEEAAATQ